MRVKAKGNVEQVLAQIDDFESAITSTAIPRALNTLGQQADVAGRRKIRDIYGIATGDLAPYFDVNLASAGNLEVRIVAKGKGFPLRFFKPRRTATGIVVTIKGRQVTIPHAFIPKGALGSTDQVFARGRYGAGSTAAARRHPGRKAELARGGGSSLFRPSGESFGRFGFGLGRFPITLLRSSSAPDALSNPDVIEAMNDRVSQQAASVLAREIRAVKRGF